MCIYIYTHINTEWEREREMFVCVCVHLCATHIDRVTWRIRLNRETIKSQRPKGHAGMPHTWSLEPVSPPKMAREKYIKISSHSTHVLEYRTCTCLITDMGLSLNRVPQNLMVHHFYTLEEFGVSPIFRYTIYPHISHIYSIQTLYGVPSCQSCQFRPIPHGPQRVFCPVILWFTPEKASQTPERCTDWCRAISQRFQVTHVDNGESWRAPQSQGFLFDWRP